MTKPGAHRDMKPDARPDAKPDPKPYVVTDPAAADFLASPNTRYLLGPFFRGESSLSDAAAALGGMKLNTLHRRVRQMVGLGLLEETRLETRGAHRVRLYRATHQEFVVPLELTSSVNLESYTDARLKSSISIVARGVANEMQRCAPRWGVRVFPSSGGSAFQQMIALDEAGDELERRDFASDLGVCLAPDDAKAFKNELQTLYDRYRSLARNEDEGDWYFLCMGFAPT